MPTMPPAAHHLVLRDTLLDEGCAALQLLLRLHFEAADDNQPHYEEADVFLVFQIRLGGSGHNSVANNFQAAFSSLSAVTSTGWLRPHAFLRGLECTRNILKYQYTIQYGKTLDHIRTPVSPFNTVYLTSPETQSGIRGSQARVPGAR